MTATTLTLPQTLAQSLDTGTCGLALAAVEHALTGVGTWQDVHQLIRHVATAPIDASAHAGLFYGAPALAFVLHAASADGRARAAATAASLDAHVHRLTQHRLALAALRAQSGQWARFKEYDLFYGLVGLGVLLLHRAPSSDMLGDVLRYAVGLTRPQKHDGAVLPGWWVGHDPDPKAPTPGGHANLGMAHGAAGILALLATASRRGSTVHGHREAIEALQAWFDQWRQHGPDGCWWPEWVTRDEIRTGQTTQPAPGRPSWCYGAIGIARAQQIAAIATGDQHRRAQAETTIAACLTTPQLAQLTGAGLCHGIAGLYQTAFRAAADAADPAIDHHLSIAAESLIRHANDRLDDPGLLNGRAGLNLALSTLRRGQAPISEWDACLLIN